MTNSKQQVALKVKEELEKVYDLLDTLRTKILTAETEQEKAKYTEMYKSLQAKKQEFQKVYKSYLMNN